MAAVNRCWDVHFGAAPPMTEERFRDEMRTLDVWPSNSMIASEDGEPIGVLIGTKREREVLVLRVGVAPGHRRQGHGSHLLTSLSQKLAVLGPERLVAEVPDELEDAGRFFVAAGWTSEIALRDWRRGVAAARDVPSDLVVPTAIEHLEADGVLEESSPSDPSARAAWERQRRTIANRSDEIEAWAVASPERIEAYALTLPVDDGEVRVLDLGTGGGDRSRLFLRVVCDAVTARAGAELVIPRVVPGEYPDELLAELGFEPDERYHRFSTEATPL